MSLAIYAALLFSFMWLGIFTCALLLYRWLFRIDRDQRDSRKIPFERGL